MTPGDQLSELGIIVVYLKNTHMNVATYLETRRPNSS